MTSARSGTSSGRPYAVTMRNAQSRRSGSGRWGGDRHQFRGAIRRSSRTAVHHRPGRTRTAVSRTDISRKEYRTAVDALIAHHLPSP